MSHALITRDFADATYSFALNLGQWEELQERVNCGPDELFWKLHRREYRASWLREIIRLGLIGGGANAIEAKRLVERYVDTAPFSDSLPLALMIVARSVYRPDEGDDDKKNERNASTNGDDRTRSDSRQSTATVQ